TLPLGARHIRAEVWSLEKAASPAIYFIHQPEFYQRAGLYQEKGADYPDNAERFIFFSKCVVFLARNLAEPIDVVHAHDWQTGLVPLLIRHQQRWEGWRNAPSTCFTIHNIIYQGIFPGAKYSLTNLPPDYFRPDGVEFYGNLNCMKAGLCYAQALTTVSPRYAQEITTRELGGGLDGVLRSRRDPPVGIVNGVDYSEWKTNHNPHLRFTYGPGRMEGKTAEKLALQRELGLPVNAEVPLFGNVGRLAEQKGIDILLGALEEMLAAPMQFISLGRGQPHYEGALMDLARRYPDKVAARIGYEEELSHRIEAGSDFFLMPSRYEPCGLNQLYSLRYGTIPIVRATGGLDDTVVDIAEAPERADGIKFNEYSARALAKAIRKALVLYQEPALMRHFIQNAMAVEFLWQDTAAQYIKVYQRIPRSERE
ncbi:MAG: glycogen synthase, partial [Candidatus Omnitrophica bacterium]|nr:glycogen synthase [Candidatus Omnitrophota bacterium]